MGMKTTFLFIFLFAVQIFAQKINCPAGISSLSYCVKNNIRSTGCVQASSFNEAVAKCKGAASVWDLNNSIYGLSNVAAGTWMCSSDPSKEKICRGEKARGLTWEPTNQKDGLCYQEINGARQPCDFQHMAVEAPSKAAVSENQVAQNPVAQNDEVSDQVRQCVRNALARNAQCTEEQAATKLKCEKYKDENSDISSIQSAIGQIGSGLIGKGKALAASGDGSQSELCAKTSLMTSAGASLMNAMKDTCEKEQKSCLNTCSKAKDTDLVTECGSVAKPNPSEDVSSADFAFLSEQQRAFSLAISSALNYCEVDATAEKDMLKGALNDALKAQAAAQACACAFSTTAGSGPTCPPTTAQCFANRNLPGCENAFAVNCALGAGDYNMPTCVCLRDQTSLSCRTALAAAPKVMGADIKNGTTPASGFAGGGSGAISPGGSGFDSDIDFSSKRAGISADTSKAGNLGLLGQSSQSAVGGGGGGGGGSGGAPAATGAPGEEEKSGLGGAFSNLKSMVGSLFGGGKSASTVNTKSESRGVNFDPDKYKNPKGLRGLAGGTGFGSKNMDIFKMIKTRHVDRDKAGTFFDPAYDPK